jgi:HSP20 family protein
MALVRSLPARPVYSPQSDITRLFNSFFDTATPVGASLTRQARSFAPAIDIVEKGDEFVLTADLPGLTESDVKLEILDGVLTISGERRSEHDHSGEGYRRIERSFGSFSRRLSLPKGVDADSVKASFTNGVLEVRVPKPAESQPKQVEIAASA